MANRMTTASGLYPIRTVAEITGINPVTLRAWERRYGLIKPQRTPKGHRLYSKEHIAQLKRILELVDQGISIGQVKQILESEAAAPPAAPLPAAVTEDPWENYRQGMLQAIMRFDEAGLDTTYNDGLSLYPVDLVTRFLILPLLQELGDRRRDPPAGEAEAHFFQTYLRNKLGARFHHQSTQTRGPRLMAACLPGESSEAELLLFSLSAMTRGYRMVLLGANMALDPLPLALERSGGLALLLFASIEPPTALIRTHLPALAKQVAQPIFIGGQMAVIHCDPLKEAGLVPLVSDVQGALRQIDDSLSVRAHCAD